MPKSSSTSLEWPEESHRPRKKFLPLRKIMSTILSNLRINATPIPTLLANSIMAVEPRTILDLTAANSQTPMWQNLTWSRSTYKTRMTMGGRRLSSRI